MKEVKYFCDKCKKEIIDNRKNIFKITRMCTFFIASFEKILCDECLKKFDKWLLK